MNSLIGRTWNGEVALAKAYWVYSAIGGLAFGLLRGLAETLAAGQNAPAFDLLLLGTNLTWYAYIGFMAVAVWRCADSYPGPWIWAGLAKTSVVLGILMAASEIIWALGTYGTAPA